MSMRQSADNRMMDILEDYTRVTDTLDFICCGIENGLPMPNFIPVCNDTLLTHYLTKIAECITSMRKERHE